MQNTQTVIKFPTRITATAFESLLTKHHVQSISSVIVKFDWTLVEWCDLFELTLITLWIKELVLNKVKVLFLSPKNATLKSFLSRYEFGRFLAEQGIVSGLRYANIGSDALSSTPYFPIKFHHELSFKNFMTYLSDPESYAATFSDVLNAGFINKEHLRNIILQELGDNMYRHGRGLLASNAMAKFGISEDDKNKRIGLRNSLVSSSSPFEKMFFETLNGREYFTVIFCDKGPGILQTLKKNFQENNSEKPVIECDVLEYAFYEYSTSRTIQERLGDLAEIFENFNDQSGSPPVMPPPTGLYLLLNIVRQYRGLLYLRSGRSIVAYDFLNDRSAMKSSDFNGYKRLANFKGTQIKIHFPLDYRNAAITIEQQKFRFPETEKDVLYAYFNIADYFSADNKDNYTTEKNSFIRFYQDVDRFKGTHSGRLRGIILDLAEIKTISNKALYLVIAKLMISQEKNYSHVLINATPQSVNALKLAFAAASESRKPIILFDINFKREVIGVTPKEEQAFDEFFARPYIVNEPGEESFMYKYEHLFIVDHEVTLKHRRRAIFKAARVQIEERLNKIILDVPNKVFYPNVKVEMPSRFFAEGYFEIGELFQLPPAKQLLKQWVTYLFFEKKPLHIIAVGKPCTMLLEAIIKEREIYGSGYLFKHISIPNPDLIDFSFLFELESLFFNAEKITIFCDVVGTAMTLGKIIPHLDHVSEIEIIGIVNARSDSGDGVVINNKKYGMSAIVNHTIKFHPNRPAGWDGNMVRQVDKDTFTIVKQNVKKPAALWTGEQAEQFINESIIADNKYFIGHFTHDQTHLTYLIDIPLVTKAFGDAIASFICDDFLRHHKDMHPVPAQNKIVYLNDKVGLREIVRQVASSLLFSPEPLGNNELLYDNYESLDYYGKTIIVIDNAFDNGENLLRMIDLCSRKGAGYIYIYVLFKRGTDYAARRLRAIRDYDGAKVKFNYLAEFNIPTYRPDNCPVCSQRQSLESLRDQIKNEKGLSRITDLITNELTHNQAINLRYISEDHYQFERLQTKYDPDMVNFRILLEGAKTDLLSRNRVNDIICAYQDDEDMRSALLMVRVIINEQLFPALEKCGNNESPFEDDLKANLINLSLYGLNAIQALASDQLDHLLQILLVADEDNLLERLGAILSQVIADESKSVIVYKNILLSNKAHAYPRHVLSALNEVKVPVQSQPLFNAVFNYWDQQASMTNIAIINTYKKLKKCDHEIQSHLTSLKPHIAVQSPARKIFPDLSYLLDYLGSVAAGLSDLGNFNFDHSYINRAAVQLLTKLKALMNNAQLMLSSGDAPSVRDLNKWVSDIDTVLYKDEDNLTTLLNLCVSNLSSLVIYLLRILPKNLGIKIQLEQPETACVAFGDKNGLEAVFSNILNNIISHANATKILVRLTIENDNQDIIVRVYDNGRKLPDTIKYNIGLNTCKENTARYFGMFNLLPLAENDPYFNEGFTKEAIVSLKFIQPRYEIKQDQ